MAQKSKSYEYLILEPLHDSYSWLCEIYDDMGRIAHETDCYDSRRKAAEAAKEWIASKLKPISQTGHE